MLPLFDPAAPQVVRYRNQHDFLSNMFPLPVILYGYTFGSNEIAYVAAKKAGDDWHRRLAALPHTWDGSFAARKLGQKRDRPLVPNWDKVVRFKIMENLGYQKFSNATMADRLVATYPMELIEGNNHRDKFWGMVCEDGEWVGENNLGKLQMRLRLELVTVRESRTKDLRLFLPPHLRG